MTIISLYSQNKWKIDQSLTFIWLISITILSFSFFQQYIENIEPCALCKIQRWIYFFIFVISPIGMFQQFNEPIRLILNGIILIGLFVAAYHLLIQLGWITDRCTITQKIENINDFMQVLEKPKNSCATIGWKLFGLSAAVYNMVFFLSSLLILNYKRIKRNFLCPKKIERKKRQQQRSVL